MATNLPTNFAAGTTGHVEAHDATNDAVNKLSVQIDNILQTAPAAGYTDANAVDAVATALVPGAGLAKNYSAGQITLSVNLPVVALPSGTTVTTANAGANALVVFY